MEKDDQQLVAEYRGGSEQALAVLIQRHMKKVYAFAYRYVGRVEDAEEITQETFLKMWKHFGRYRADKKFITWLLAIGRNTAVDWLRKKKNIAFSDVETFVEGDTYQDSVVDSAPNPNELFARAEAREHADALLAQLPLLYREIVGMHVGDDMTFEEIGEVVGRPLNTVKSQYRRGITMLRDMLDGHMHQK